MLKNLLDKLDNNYEKHNSIRQVVLEIEMMAQGLRNSVVGQVAQGFGKAGTHGHLQESKSQLTWLNVSASSGIKNEQ